MEASFGGMENEKHTCRGKEKKTEIAEYFLQVTVLTQLAIRWQKCDVISVGFSTSRSVKSIQIGFPLEARRSTLVSSPFFAQFSETRKANNGRAFSKSVATKWNSLFCQQTLTTKLFILSRRLCVFKFPQRTVTLDVFSDWNLRFHVFKFLQDEAYPCVYLMLGFLQFIPPKYAKRKNARAHARIFYHTYHKYYKQWW